MLAIATAWLLFMALVIVIGAFKISKLGKDCPN